MESTVFAIRIHSFVSRINEKCHRCIWIFEMMTTRMAAKLAVQIACLQFLGEEGGKLIEYLEISNNSMNTPVQPIIIIVEIINLR